LIQAGPCVVVSKRSKEVDGYEAVQIGFDEIAERLVNKPRLGHFRKAGVVPQRFLREFRGPESQELEVGQSLTVDMFQPGERIDVVGTSKGRGFTSVRKRWGSKPGRASHGSMYFNRPGSGGASSYPSRTFPGKKNSGHHGNTRETTLNLVIVKCDPERNLIAVRGSVPGANNGFVLLRKRAVAKKKAVK
jgi:large subunit ribosomal protein L3